MTKEERAAVRVDEASVTIDRFYATTAERLFRCWTDPALVARWLAPGPWMKCSVPAYDARKGGRFRIEMSGTRPDGSAMKMAYEGTFDEVVPARKLVMTWAGNAAEAEPPTTVTVTFAPVEGGTRLRLVHAGLPGSEFAEGAGQGWAAAMETLAGVA